MKIIEHFLVVVTVAVLVGMGIFIWEGKNGVPTNIDTDVHEAYAAIDALSIDGLVDLGNDIIEEFRRDNL